MLSATYTVHRQTDGSFHVRLTKPGALPRTAINFGSEAEAAAWIARDRRLNEFTNPWVADAHRGRNRR
jgi:hypothetical protein